MSRTLAQKITFKLLISLIMVFTIVGFVATYVIGNKIVEEKERESDQVAKKLIVSIAQSMWDFDIDAAKATMENYVGDQNILEIDLLDENGKEVAEVYSTALSEEHTKYFETIETKIESDVSHIHDNGIDANNASNMQNLSSVDFRLAQKVQSHIYPINYTHKGKNYVLGTLKIYHDHSFAKNLMVEFSFKIILVSALLITFLSYIIYRTIAADMQPVSEITNALNHALDDEKVSISNISSDIQELNFLKQTLDKTITKNSSVREDLERLVLERTMELEDYKAHLEQMVEEQTKDLIIAKDQAEASNRAKSEFVANISHELRTPLHAITNFSKMIISKFDRLNKEKIISYSENISKSSDRLLGLVNNLLDVSKLESGKMTLDISMVNISEVLNNVLSEIFSVSQIKNIEIFTSKKLTREKFEVDEKKIHQVILNLLSNAIKFSPEGKKITIEVIDSIFKEGQAIQFSVIDEGMGIPEDELEVIFEKFIQSTKSNMGAGGTGLGLAICNQIIELHNGKIWAENRPNNEGAIFSFVIPIHYNFDK